MFAEMCGGRRFADVNCWCRVVGNSFLGPQIATALIIGLSQRGSFETRNETYNSAPGRSGQHVVLLVEVHLDDREAELDHEDGRRVGQWAPTNSDLQRKDT